MRALEQVKINLGITGEYQDALLQGYIDEVIEFMVDAGVSRGVAESERAFGVLTRGVADLWNYGSGGTKLSEYFKMRVIQLSYVKGDLCE